MKATPCPRRSLTFRQGRANGARKCREETNVQHRDVQHVSKLVVAAVLGIAGASGAVAQNYPTRPITMIIPFAAGGPTDVLGRMVGQKMSEALGQQVIIENVGGAGGMTGGLRVAAAPADGYIMELGTVGTHAQNQTLYKRPLYNAANDFTPVALIAEIPTVLIVRKDLPVNNLKEFVEYAKKNQDKMSYGSAGTGSATHLACIVLDAAMGTHITHVPYRGTGPAMGDLQAGRIDYLCDIVTTAKPQIDGGTVKALAMMNKHPLAGAAERADRRGAGGARRRGLHLERDLPAEERAGSDRQEAQRGDGFGDAQPAGQGAARRPRRPDRDRRPRDPGLPARLRQERDREVGGADQGERRHRGLTDRGPTA